MGRASPGRSWKGEVLSPSIGRLWVQCLASPVGWEEKPFFLEAVLERRPHSELPFACLLEESVGVNHTLSYLKLFTIWRRWFPKWNSRPYTAYAKDKENGTEAAPYKLRIHSWPSSTHFDKLLDGEESHLSSPLPRKKKFGDLMKCRID